MNFPCGLLLLLASTFSVLQATSDIANGEYVNSWAVEIEGGPEVARAVAEQHGYRIITVLRHIADHYELARSDTPHRSRRSADHHTQKLSDDRRVRYVEQQQHRTRVKREVSNPHTGGDVFNKYNNPNDPEFMRQWYLVQPDKTSNRRENNKPDLMVRDAWAMGYSGAGSVVTIIDDGLEHTHSDLKRNYIAAVSYDFNNNRDNPAPRYDPTNENKHGTRCAGEVAMVANNSICGTGIAFNAWIGGSKILDGPVTDTIESRAISYKRDIVDIYSSSWGPSDNGKTCEGPGKLTRIALEDGVNKGRQGRGSLFFVASGNGGASGDNCNCDGYTSSKYTISISSVSENGYMPYYGERCSSTLTSAFSSGSYSEGKVISTDLHNLCTDAHSGTSAAAPMAAAIAALLLEANRRLHWRDVQHLMIQASFINSLEGNSGWYRNGAGYCVNLAFGFGLINAAEVIRLANPLTYKGVGEQKTCRVESDSDSGFPRAFKSGQSVEVSFFTDGCAGQNNEIGNLEHVEVVVTIRHKKRGNVFVELQSPSGTRTVIMLERVNDLSTEGFKNWTLMSLHNWGEQPKGEWILRVADRTNDNLEGSLDSATLILYGTKEKPEHQKNMQTLCGNLKQYADTLTNIVPVERNSGRPSIWNNVKKPSNFKAQEKEPTEDNSRVSSVESLKKLLNSFSRG